MRAIYVFVFLSFLITSCYHSNQNSILVEDQKSLEEAIQKAQPGDEIIMANKIWKDIRINFNANGSEKKPITLRAETDGEVFIEGISDLKFGGDYLTVKGLHFRNGHAVSGALVQFKSDDAKVANHCMLTNSVIENFNQPSRDIKDHWIEFWGRNNKLDHCYISGKSNQGPTIRVFIRGIESIKNHHQIINNHFGPRPRKGGPRAETIQVGDSYTSMSPSHTLVANNYFERCNGEVEVISSKTNFNEFRNNVFFMCEGSLVTRHGNYCTIDGNLFIGDGESENYGGIRLINTGHWVSNNYFYKLKGNQFRSPLAVMNGIPKSPLNRYNQVTDAVIAYNSWIDCTAPLHFGVGSNISQSDVLPKSEIRSAVPIRTTVANNIIYNSDPTDPIIIAHDKIDGISFSNNYTNLKLPLTVGWIEHEFDFNQIGAYIMNPKNIADLDIYQGFEFGTIENDLFGNSRKQENKIGAISQDVNQPPSLLDKRIYGPDWFKGQDIGVTTQSIAVSAETGDLEGKLMAANPRDTLQLSAGDHFINSTLVIDKAIVFNFTGEAENCQLIFRNETDRQLFEMHPYGDLKINNITLVGNKSHYAFASKEKDMSALYNIALANCNVKSFDGIIKAYKHSFADKLSFKNCEFSDCNNGINLAAEIEAKGDYNAEFVIIENCSFENVTQNVINYYRGGYDESTIGGNFHLSNSSFKNCGAKEKDNVLIKTVGIINVELNENEFMNNPVKNVIVLWGAKNNKANNNITKNSGSIITEENIKQKLMY